MGTLRRNLQNYNSYGKKALAVNQRLGTFHGGACAAFVEDGARLRTNPLRRGDLSVIKHLQRGVYGIQFALDPVLLNL